MFRKKRIQEVLNWGVRQFSTFLALLTTNNTLWSHFLKYLLPALILLNLAKQINCKILYFFSSYLGHCIFFFFLSWIENIIKQCLHRSPVFVHVMLRWNTNKSAGSRPSEVCWKKSCVCSVIVELNCDIFSHCVI